MPLAALPMMMRRKIGSSLRCGIARGFRKLHVEFAAGRAGQFRSAPTMFSGGGRRGALGLELSLSLPPSLPFRNEILIATFGVVAFPNRLCLMHNSLVMLCVRGQTCFHCTSG